MWNKYSIQIDKTFRSDVNSLLVDTKYFFVLSQCDILFVHWNKSYNAPWIKIRFYSVHWTLLRVPGGVQHGIWTHLHAFWIIRESIDITMLKPYIFWNLTSIDRHCHCSSDTLTHCSEMPASLNGQLQMQHQVTACVILTTLLNRLHSPGIHKRAMSRPSYSRPIGLLWLSNTVKATNGGQHETWKLAFRPPPWWP